MVQLGSLLTKGLTLVSHMALQNPQPAFCVLSPAVNRPRVAHGGWLVDGEWAGQGARPGAPPSSRMEVPWLSFILVALLGV